MAAHDEGESDPDTVTTFTVSACDSSRRAEQARLFNSCFKKRIDEQGLAWRYDQSPHGPSLSFVSRPPEHEAVSGYACSPRLALARGDLQTLAVVGETGDVMTHPEWRKRGLFSVLDKQAMAASRAQGWPFVFGLPNRRSAHIFLELGWRAVGSVRPWTFLFKADAASRTTRLREGRWRALTTGFSVRDCARQRRRARAESTTFRVEPLTRFPEAVTALALHVAARHAFMIRRDAAYLNWRFVDAPSGIHRALGLFDAGAELAGYAVVQMPRPGASHGYLVDVLGRDAGAEGAAVEAGLQALESLGSSYAEATAIDGSWWSQRLRQSGFLPPRGTNHLSVIVHIHQPDHPLARAALDPASWYMTDGDRDDETMG